MEYDIGRSKGGMTAEVDFPAWRKPAQMVCASFLYGKSRFGKPVFHGNFHHDALWNPRIQDTDSSRISFKDGIRKGIDNIFVSL